MESIMEVLPGRMMTAGSSTTTTSVEEDISWDDWSPEINWNQVSNNPDYDFHNLTPHPADTTTNDAFPLADAFGTQGWACNTSSATTSITSASTPTDEPISASAPAVGDSMASDFSSPRGSRRGSLHRQEEPGPRPCDIDSAQGIGIPHRHHRHRAPCLPFH
ncbi:hypothetical protein HPP92_011160 [Vanilla planifolia]|uniref:Uncharacterized protein n=1 Tax=Vanilla planifolia TaxID=51239 RepID=A0A835R537_VANPL|nr:hypothetical protein HPP92_011160 [Vanilla planifolia]